MSHHHGYIQDQDNYVRRLRRVEGQIRGIQRMVENDEYCIDILTQISAAQAALKNVGLQLLDDHMRHCVRDAVLESDAAAEQKFQEVSQAVARFTR